MFLHKFDILNRNLNGLLQKLFPVVTKLCAVTKLGGLTEVVYEINIQKEWHWPPNILKMEVDLQRLFGLQAT
jgi:hypothetical protein